MNYLALLIDQWTGNILDGIVPYDEKWAYYNNRIRKGGWSAPGLGCKMIPN